MNTTEAAPVAARLNPKPVAALATVVTLDATLDIGRLNLSTPFMVNSITLAMLRPHQDYLAFYCVENHYKHIILFQVWHTVRPVYSINTLPDVVAVIE
jgi:hypothetical protein